MPKNVHRIEGDIASPPLPRFCKNLDGIQ